MADLKHPEKHAHNEDHILLRETVLEQQEQIKKLIEEVNFHRSVFRQMGVNIVGDFE